MRHIMLMVLSPFSKDINSQTYTDLNGEFEAECIHTNETAVRYIDWALKTKRFAFLEKIYAFVSEDVNKDKVIEVDGDKHFTQSDHKRFKELIQHLEIPMDDVTLFNNGDLKGSFLSASEMYDKLMMDFGEDIENTIIHIDMTGGPRHTSMLMLALIHLLIHNNAKIGYVLYTNLQNKIIEDATDVMEMFDLIGGTHEFIAFGSVDYIKSYFSDKKVKSGELRILLDSMEDFSEALRICVGKDELKEKLRVLSDSINEYKLYLDTPEGQKVLEQERFFSKLLKTIKKEYSAVLPTSQGDADLLDIIEWCLNRGFLQQSVTLFTEWLPDYLVDGNMVIVKRKAIIDECNMLKASYERWPAYLFRKFDGNFLLPKARSVVKERFKNDGSMNNINLLTYNAFIGVSRIACPNVLAFRDVVMGKNQELYNLANELIKLDEVARDNDILEILLASKEGSLIHYIINNSPYCGKGIEAYLEKHNVEKLSLSSIIIKLLGGFKKDVLRERFLLADDQKDMNQEIKKEFKKYPRVIATDTARRKAILEKFISNGDIEINFEKDRFYNLLGKYLKCVYDWRNKFNHAAAKNGCKKTSDTIKSEIIEAIALIKEQSA